jgi:flagellar biosynthesis/type III secretory pathway protein FliH
MEEPAEKNDTPLKDSEISRLIEVSKNSAYKKQDAIPTRNLIDFKPKSLVDLAFKKVVDKHQEETEGENSDLISQATSEIDKSAKESEDFLEKIEKLNDETPSISPTEQLDDKTEHMGEGLEKLPVEALKEEPQIPPENLDVENNLVAASKTEVLTLNEKTSETVDNAKKEGIEIGKKMSFSEAENAFGEGTKTLYNIIENLKNKNSIDKSHLMDTILSTVTSIASERAGQVIDQHPESFKKKLITFIDEIDKTSKKIILNLNPRDAKLLSSKILEHFPEDDLQIKENMDLFRGDSILQLGGIEIGDLISERIAFDTEIELPSGSNIKNIEPKLTVPENTKINKTSDSEK